MITFRDVTERRKRDEERGRTLAAAEERAAVNPLTGLANHRTFHERLRAEVEGARRRKRGLALVLMDLDHFKRVNDVHGHQVGDRVLQHAAQRARGRDAGGRAGGPGRRRGVRHDPARGRRRRGPPGRRARAPGRRGRPLPHGRPDDDVRRGVRHLPGRRRRRALPARRRRALLGEAPRPRRGDALLPGDHPGAVGPGAGRAPRAPAGAGQHPPPGPGRGREGPLHAPPLRARRRALRGAGRRPGVAAGALPAAGRRRPRARRGEDRRAGRDPLQTGQAHAPRNTSWSRSTRSSAPGSWPRR